MVKSTLRRWFGVFRDQTNINELPRIKSKARLALERLEGRDVPSTSIPLNGNTWTEIGPRPIINGQAPGQQSATGRFDSVVSAPLPGGGVGSPNVLFAASVVSGIWRSLDGGTTWSPRIETLTANTPVNSATVIKAVPRTTTNTVYAVSNQGFDNFIYLSNNNGDTFTRIGTTQFTKRAIREIVIVPDSAFPDDQTKDVIYAAVQFNPDPAAMPPNTPAAFPSGIYRSKDGGQTWVNITNTNTAAANFPFPSIALSFSDIDIDPTNPEVVYASINSGPEAGLYRATNAFSTPATAASPASWNVRLGGAAFFSGVIPQKVQTSLSSRVPGQIFTAMYDANSLQILYRSNDTGINWTPILGVAFQAGGTVPDFAGGQAANYGTFEVSSGSGFDPNRQIIYAAGFGDVAGNLFISRDSGLTWQDISVGPNGAGAYAGVHDFSFDSTGRMLTATQGGVYRLNSENPVIWQSLNGQPGLGSLSAIQVGGLGLHPTNANKAVANIGLPIGTAAGQHTAVLFNDTYGWTTVDQNGGAPFSVGPVLGANRDGTGTVIYDFNTPNTVYRLTPFTGDASWIRRSDDGGVTWFDAANPGLPQSLFARNPLIINPSDSRQLLYVADDVYLYDRDTFDWVAAMGAPPTQFVDAMGGSAPGDITAIGMARQSGIIYIATTPGYLPTDIPMAPGMPPPAATKIFAFGLIPNTWVELNVPTGFGTSTVTSITVDPNNRFSFFMTTADGRIFHQRTNPLVPPNPVPPTPPSVKWATNYVQINPTGGANVPPAAPGLNAVVLDPFILTSSSDDILYVATNGGVFKLNNPSSAAPFVWQRVGGTELPNSPATDLDLNTTTGILAVSLNGRGVWELQIRSLIRGQIFIDANGDGIKNGAESGISGFIIAVRDLASNTIIATTTTDVNGNYEFRSITPGNYRIEQITPAGWVRTTGSNDTTITIGPGANDVIVGTYTGMGPPPAGVQVKPQLDFGNYKVNSISGVKFNDTNLNGVRDVGEQGAPNFRIYIDVNNNNMFDAGEVFTFSDANGNYTLANLGPMSVNGMVSTQPFSPFRIREEAQAGWNQISVNPAPVAALSGEVFGGINFGNVRPGAIRGRKFFDTNGNAALDVGEVGIPNITIFIDANGNGIFDGGEDSRLTDANGFFEFASLPAGTYRVREVQQAGFVQTTPNPADIVMTTPISVVGNVIFGNKPQIQPWTETGPRPITNGQSPNRPASTGRFDAVATVSATTPGAPDIVFAASINGGIWRSLDGGQTWSPRTDIYNINSTPSNSVTAIKAIKRSTGNTVYAASSYLGDGFVYVSTDNGETFRPVGLTDFTKRRITELAVFADPADPTNPAKDLIYASVQFAGTIPPDDPTQFPGGVYRSKNGGLTWENITAFGFPFNASNGFANSPQLLTFSDIDVDPTNREVVYVSVNSGPQAGVYRATNGYTAPGTSGSPVNWQLRLGGSSFFTGTLPARVQTTISPVLPSVIFVTVSEVPPLAGSGSFITLYRTQDTGINWTPLLSTAFSPTGTIPDYTAGLGYIFNSIGVSPGSPANPTSQILFAGGFGDTGNNVMFSTNSGTTWTNIAVGQNGTGPYTGIRNMTFDSNNRLLLATEGGIFRLNQTQPNVNWVSLNGTPGAGALNTYQVSPFGLGLHPTNGNTFIANSPVLHNAVRVTAQGPNAPGQTVDSSAGAPFATGLGNRWGSGEVIYDFNNPQTVYRSTDKLTPADTDWLRRSDDGGNTWRGIADAQIPFRGPFVINPSDSRELLLGADDLYLYNSAADAWFTGGTGIPSLQFIAGPGTITAIGWARQNQLIYVATTAGQYDPFDVFRTRIYVLDRTGALAPDWVELSRPVSLGLTENITQILVDPNNPYHVFLTTDGGQVFDQRTNPLVAFLNPNPPANFNATANWVQLNPGGFTNVPPQAIVANATGTNVIGLDPNIATNPFDDILFLGTNNGVFSLLIVPNQTENFVWQQVGGIELPNSPVTDIDVNTTTGILGVGTDGRGVWQFQIRSLIRAQVFEDLNGNAVLDAGENGLAGFVVSLTDVGSNSVIATTTTDAQGFYEFRSVTAGTYNVSVSVPPFWVATTAVVPNFTVGLRDSILAVGTPGPGVQIVPQLNMGNYRRSSISGQVFQDANQNGVRDTGEGGVPGFVIYIDFNNNGNLDPNEDVNFIDENGNSIQDPDEPVTRVVTDASGNYSLINLGPAFRLGAPSTFPAPPYSVREVVQAGWIQTTTNPAPISPNSNQNVQNIRFGVFRQSSISGIKFNDINANGIFDAGEPGLANWRIYVDANFNNAFDTGETSQLTDINGFFQFLNLAPGTYRIREVQQNGWVQTTVNPADITLTGSNSANNLQFGNFFKASNSQLFANWLPIGPAPQLNGSGIGSPSVSGRVADISVDPTNPNRYFMTAAGGGVWRTTTGGNTWVSLTNNIPGLTPFQSTPYYGEVAIAPSSPNTIYVATGEAATGNPGRGFLKSLDSGDTWTRILGPGGAFNGTVTTQIIVDPNNANLVFASVNGFGVSGVWRTTDGGTNWTNTTATDPLFTTNTYFSDIQVDATNPNVVYAAVGAGGGDLSNGIYRTSNALAPAPTWTLLIGGSAFVPGALPGNIRLALSPTQPSTIYAALARATDPGSGDSKFLAVYKSSDSGVNWTNLVNAPSFANAQGGYNFAIAVHPTNPNVVVAGGDGTGFAQSTNLIVATNDGGLTWRDTINGSGATLGPHTDVHSIVFDKSGRLLVGSDGGMFRMNNATLPAPTLIPPFGNVVPNWVSLNGSTGSLNNLNTIQFIGIATHPTNPRAVAGGSQDNGVGLYNGNLAWLTTDGGDAGEVIWDFDRPNILYHIAPIASVGANNYIQKSVDGGLTWQPAVTGIAGQSQQNTLFYPPIVMDPSNSMRLFTGTDKVWVTDNGGVQWDQKTKFSPTIDVNVPDTKLSGQNPPIPIEAIGVGRPVDTVIFVSQGGQLLRIILPLPFPMQPTMDDWINVTPPGVGPFNPVTRILLDPTNPNTVYAMVGAAGGTHVWRSTNLGGSWTSLDGPANSANRLPDLTSYSIALDPRIATDPNDDILYIGNDNGVWAMQNPNGTSFNWLRVGQDNLPVVPVFDLDLNTTTGVLAAGTHGRGVWETRIRGDIQGQAFEDINGNAVFDVGEPTLSGVTIRVLDATPGPSFGAELATTITDANGFYEFPSLRAGNYSVVQVTPNGMVQTTANPGAFLDFTEQSVAVPSFVGTPPATFTIEPRLNFGSFRRGSISGVKFEDRNGNGVREAGEPGLANFVIYIDANNNSARDWTDLDGDSVWDNGEGEQWITSDTIGNYTLPNIGPRFVLGVPTNDPYIIREIQQVGFQQTSAVPTPFTITSGQNLTGVNVGNIRIGRIEGFIFNDLNGDGIQQIGDVGLGGMTLQLVDNSTGLVFRTLVSDPDGTYEFLSIPAGNYRLQQSLPSGWIQTFPASPNPVFYTISLAATDQVTGFRFGNFQLFSISGIKFEDLNGNGVRDGGENGVPNFVIQVTNLSTGAQSSAVTDAFGNYTFTNLGPGVFQIREVQKAGWLQTTTNPADIQGTSGTNRPNTNFGNFRLVTATGAVFNDRNGNGFRDVGEEGLPGFTVFLDKDNNGTIDATATTDANGNYSFGTLGPATYRIRQQPRRGWTITSPVTGDYLFTAISSSNPSGLNFGNSNTGIYALGQDAGGAPTVSIRRVSDNFETLRFAAYSNAFRGGVRVATGFTQGDTTPVVVTAAGPGGGPHVRLFNATTGDELFSFFAFDPRFTGGVNVAVGDVNGDGFDDIVVGADAGGGPHVKVISGQTHQDLYSFFAYAANFSGGVRVSTGDVDGDGKADIITGAGPGGGPHVKVFSGATGQVIRSFFAYSPAFTGGVYVTGGDFNGDGRADIATGAGKGGGPHVRIFHGTSLAELASTFAYEATFNGGVRVFAIDVNFDNRVDLVTAPGPGRQPQVKAFSMNGSSLSQLSSYNGFDPTFLGGVWVG